jgi:hypothetical protein
MTADGPVDASLVSSLKDLSARLVDVAALETKTLAAELNVLSLFREWMAPAAIHGEPIPIGYKRYSFKTPKQAEQWTYLPEGFPSSDRGKPLLALHVLETSSMEPSQTEGEGAAISNQYVSDCVYLLKDRRWALVERVGVLCDGPASNSQWEGRCRLVTDRMLVGRYPVGSIAEGLLASANKALASVASRVDTLNQRAGQVEEYKRLLKAHPIAK